MIPINNQMKTKKLSLHNKPLIHCLHLFRSIKVATRIWFAIQRGVKSPDFEDRVKLIKTTYYEPLDKYFYTAFKR